MPEQARRYVVIGAGAVGGILAAQWASTGLSVLLVARGEHGKRIASDGLLVRRPTGSDVIALDVASSPDSVRLSPDDVLVLTVKTQDAEAAIAEWAYQPVYSDGVVSGCAAELPIVTFQNGVATEDLALRRFDRVYGATIAIAASYLEPGEIVSPSLDPVGVIWLGRHPGGHDPLQDSIVQDLTDAGFAAFSVEDTQAQKAAKLLGNLAANGTDLLSGTEDERAAAREALRQEAADVLAASGVLLPPGGSLDFHDVEFSVRPVDGHTSGHLSTWQSFARGTSSEIDYLNGEISLLARRHGVQAPLNRRLQHLLGSPHLADRRTLAELLAAREESR